MTYVEILSIISLAILCSLMLFGVYNLRMQIKSRKYKFFKGYNYGVIALIFIPAFLIYLAAYLEEKEGFMAVFSALNSMVEIILLKYDTKEVMELAGKNTLYAVATYTCFIVAALNTGLLVISLAWHYIWEHTRKYKVRFCREALVIFGLNEGSKKIYRSDSKRSKLIVDYIEKDAADKLYEERIPYHSTPTPEEFLVECASRAIKDGFFVRLIFRLLKRGSASKRKFIIVINSGEDDKNVLLCKHLVRMLADATGDDRKKYLARLRIYVMGDPEYQSIYYDIMAGGYGCLRYVNKYQRIAVDFIDQYPLSKFMTDEHVDTDTALVKNGVDINVCFIGFGRVNREIFLTSVANNQFLEAGECDPTLKKVRYHMFDRARSENDKNLNHSYYRFKHECLTLDEKDYLPLPSLPAEEFFYPTDVNDFAFYEQLRAICTARRTDLNFAVISFGTDLENIDLAQKLVEKRREWGLPNLYIFVKSENFRKEDTFIDDDGCYFIGYDADTVYGIENIIADKMQLMARHRDEIYNIDKSIAEKKREAEKKRSESPSATDAEDENGSLITDDMIAEAIAEAEEKWYKPKKQIERDTNLFASLSIRSKLNLMGLDYVREDEAGEALTFDEYMSIYAAGDMPDIKITTDGATPVITYTLDFKKSKRRNLAIQEHQRWNSFMLSRGMVPSTIDLIKHETAVNDKGEVNFTNGKSYDDRRHGNITTFEGLVEFRRIVAERDGKPEADADVIKYDYQLLDGVFWILTTAGYKIVKNSPIQIKI